MRRSRSHPYRPVGRFLVFAILAAAPVLAAAPEQTAPAPAKAAAKPGKAETSVVDRGREAARRGVEFLLDTQNDDGSWGYHAQKNPYALWAPVPGAFRSFGAATTALALMALRRWPGTDARVEAARKRGLLWLLDHVRVPRSDPMVMYSVWSYAYGLSCLSRYLETPVEGVDPARIRKVADRLVRELRVYQTVDGGWGYYDFNAQTLHPSGDSTSFTTSTALVALHEAKKAGIEVPKSLVTRAVRSLTRCRTPEGTYVYSFGWRYYPEGGINRPQGSLTRNPGCELALYLYDAGPGLDDIAHAVRNLVAKRAFAKMALHRPVPHESWFLVSGYFYLFGTMNAGECCRLLPEATVAPLREGLISMVLATRDRDGSFWDYPLYGYHKPYGTAYAVLALLDLVPPKSSAVKEE